MSSLPASTTYSTAQLSSGTDYLNGLTNYVSSLGSTKTSHDFGDTFINTRHYRTTVPDMTWPAGEALGDDTLGTEGALQAQNVNLVKAGLFKAQMAFMEYAERSRNDPENPLTGDVGFLALEIDEFMGAEFRNSYFDKGQFKNYVSSSGANIVAWMRLCMYLCGLKETQGFGINHLKVAMLKNEGNLLDVDSVGKVAAFFIALHAEKASDGTYKINLPKTR